MSYKLSNKSLEKLDTCHEDLKTIIIESIKNSPYDFGVTHGHRSSELQNDLYKKGRNESGEIIDKSKVVTYVDGYIKKSKHNYLPSLAVDIVVYVNSNITWEHEYYGIVAGHIMKIAEELFEQSKINNRITWGGSWNKFKDLPHFQI